MRRAQRVRTIGLLRNRIKIADKKKKEIQLYLDKLKLNYSKGEITYSQYVETIHKHVDGRNLNQWIEYYEHYIKKCEKLIREEKRKTAKKYVLNIFFVFLLIFVLFFSFNFFQPRFTGFITEQGFQQGVEITSEATINTTQYQAVLGQPVKWKKEIILKESGEIKIHLPKDAAKITVNKINESYSENEEALQEDLSPSQDQNFHFDLSNQRLDKEEPFHSENKTENFENTTEEIEITDRVENNLLEISESQEETKENITSTVSITGAVVSQGGFFRNVFGKITGAAVTETSTEVKEVVINETSTEYKIEYETPASYSIEEDFSKGKKITIVGPDSVHYENVLAFTELNKEVSKGKIKLYRTTGGIKEPVEIANYIDINNNNLIDKIEWVVPSLSEQTYELIIEISKAEHLDENQNFISDIYEQVKKLDWVWSEEISDGDYVRVTFEQPLDSTRDITIYPRVVSGNPRIEVYEVSPGDDSGEPDGSDLIAEFTSLNDNQYNKIYLTNLVGEQDVFDLRVVGGSIQLDYIVDPTGLFLEDWEAGNFNNWQNSNWAIATDQKHGGSNSVKCISSTTCEINSTVSIDTSTALSINVSFWIRDDDNEPADTFWYINISDGTWEQRSNIDGGSLCGDDTWCFFSVNVTDAIYKHSGFAIRFLMGEDNGENYWIDDINVTITEGDTTKPNINITFPINNTNWTNVNLDVNFTRSDDQALSNCWYSNDTYLANTSLGATCDNVTAVVWSEGKHNVTIWANDTSGNYNASRISFRIDSTKPNINITYPINNTNWTNVNLDVNYTRSDAGVGLFNCWYSNDTYLANTTLGATCDNVTAVVWSEGLHNVTVWANDSLGNINVSRISFRIDLTAPTILIQHPLNQTYNYNFTELNYTYVETNPGYCWYSNDSEVTTSLPVSMGTNFTIALKEGSTNLSVICNDTANNIGRSSVQFYLDSINPDVNITFPLNNTNWSNVNLDVNYTRSDDQALFNCWYSNDTYLANTTLGATCDNVTAVVWSEGKQNVTVWANDTSGNYNASRISFTIDTIKPDINITSPVNNTEVAGVEYDVNYTYSDAGSGLFNCWYSNDTYLKNTSLTCGDNITGVTWITGPHNVTIWANDSAGNFNWSRVNFTIITSNTAPTNPTPDINSTDGTNRSNQNLNCFDTLSDPDADDKLNVSVKWYNGTYLASTIDYNDNYAVNDFFVATLDLANTTKGENWTCSLRLYDGNLYSDWVNATYTANITNTGPNITQVWNATIKGLSSSGPNEAPAFSSAMINFTVYDYDGASDLDGTTAMVNITATENDVRTTRENTTCLLAESSGNSANYSCNITMWWWDQTGAWNITSYIKDTESNWTYNLSTDFSVGLRTSFVLGPSILRWLGIAPGQTNITSNNDPLVLNNTGNDVIGIGDLEINATNLTGEENPIYALLSGNFSASWDTGGVACSGDACTECAGTQMMSNASHVGIDGANLSRGNFTINDGDTGQEELYICLRIAGSELAVIDQPYSTASKGTWTVRILLVAVIPRRKKKKKSIGDDKLMQALDLILEELKGEYSLNKKEISEIIIKKLREKYKLTRREIAKIIVGEITIPLEIFSKNLGALESITKYMKENLNMSYREIAKEINRDERTIWTAYKKAAEKQKEPIKIKQTDVMLSISIFENKELTILESLMLHLKEKGMKYSEIAKILKRDQRNIWTIYSRAVKKVKG